MKKQKLRYTDLWQDTTVEILTEEKSNLYKQNGTVIFERPITAKNLKAIDEYNSGIAINVLLFSQAYKRRKAEMWIKKNGIEDQK